MYELLEDTVRTMRDMNGFQVQPLSHFLWPMIFSLFLTSGVFATEGQPNKVEELFKLSLADLMKVKVEVASKYEEFVGEAAGSVTSYSSNEIARLGYYTLKELANITPGYSSRDILMNTEFETRGIIGNLNSKHLILIDEIPINFARDYLAFAQNELPLMFAKQVDFLRGPASSLYGVSAFNGVISISSQQLEINGNRQKFHFGLGNDVNQRLMFNSSSRDDYWSANLFYGGFEADSTDLPVKTTSGLGDAYQNYQDDSFLYFNASYYPTNKQVLTFGLFDIKKKDGYGESWTVGGDTNSINQQTREMLLPYLKYKYKLSENVTFKAYMKGNRSIERGIQTNNIWEDPFYFSFRAHTVNREFMQEISWNNDRLGHWILGMNYDVRKQEDEKSFIFAPHNPDNNGDIPFFEGKAKTESAYLQGAREFPVLDGLRITVGIREDRGEIEASKYSEISPRLAIVQALNSRWTVKLLHGHALIAAGIKEVGHNKEKSVLLVNPNNYASIEPEVIDTNELVFMYEKPHQRLSFTAFQNQVEDEILSVDLPLEEYVGSLISDIFVNRSGRTKTKGGEIEFEYEKHPWWVIANYSQSSTKSAAGDPLQDIPKRKVNLAVSRLWLENQKFKTSAVVRWVDEYSSSDSSVNYSGQTIVDANLGVALENNLQLSLQIKNIFDKSYYQPYNGLPEIPMARRSFLFSASLEFR